MQRLAHIRKVLAPANTNGGTLSRLGESKVAVLFGSFEKRSLLDFRRTASRHVATYRQMKFLTMNSSLKARSGKLL